MQVQFGMDLYRTQVNLLANAKTHLISDVPDERDLSECVCDCTAPASVAIFTVHAIVLTTWTAQCTNALADQTYK